MTQEEKQHLPDHVTEHLRKHNVNVDDLHADVHNTLATLTPEEVSSLSSVAAKLNAAGADVHLKAQIV